MPQRINQPAHTYHQVQSARTQRQQRSHSAPSQRQKDVMERRNGAHQTLTLAQQNLAAVLFEDGAAQQPVLAVACPPPPAHSLDALLSASMVLRTPAYGTVRDTGYDGWFDAMAFMIPFAPSVAALPATHRNVCATLPNALTPGAFFLCLFVWLLRRENKE